MVEYLTGSTQASWLILNPPFFFAFLAQNLGNYGLAVILIREAKVRWGKGWASVLLLGAAYGIVNEGIGAATLFNPGDASSLGIVATYGHWLGVNWVWATQLVLIVHPVFSVALPILLLDLALPETRGKSLLTLPEIRWAIAGLSVDAAGTLYFVGYVRNFYAGPVLWIGCLAAIGILVFASSEVKADLLLPTGTLPTTRPLTMFAFAVGFFVVFTFGADAMASNGVAPVIIIFFLLITGSLALRWVVGHVGRKGNALVLVALCTGLVAVLMPQGFFGQLGTGMGIAPVVAGDLLVAALLAYLWNKHSHESAATATTVSPSA